MTVHSFSTQYNRTVLIISPLTWVTSNHHSSDIVHRRRGTDRLSMTTVMDRPLTLPPDMV